MTRPQIALVSESCGKRERAWAALPQAVTRKPLTLGRGNGINEILTAVRRPKFAANKRSPALNVRLQCPKNRINFDACPPLYFQVERVHGTAGMCL